VKIGRARANSTEKRRFGAAKCVANPGSGGKITTSQKALNTKSREISSLMKIGAAKRFWVLMLLTLAIRLPADPLSNWSWRFPSPQGNILLGVTYGAGQFVAVGDNGTIITSSDGYHWTNQSSGISTPLRAIACAQGEFAAVGDGGVILVSSNAVNWQQIPQLTSNTLRAVAGANPQARFGFSQFLAVGDSGAAVAGNYNTNWLPTASRTSNSLYGITWERNWYYTVVGASGTVIEIDNTGTYLVPQSHVGTSNMLYAVAADGNGQYVAGGELYDAIDSWNPGPDEILYSNPHYFDRLWTNEAWADGVGSLTPFQTLWYLSEFFIMTGFAYGPNGFVGVGYTGIGLEYHPAVVMTSTGGSNWIELSSSICEDGLNAITYGNGLYVAVGDFGSIVVSTDTTNWTTVTPDRRGFIVAMACNTNLCIASAESVWYSWGFPDFSTIVSTNGLNWTVSGYGPMGFASITSLACSSTNFVGVCSAGVVTTSDGINWITNALSSNSLNGVNYANGRYFAVGNNGGIYSSADGWHWSGCSINSSGTLYATAFGNGMYLTAGTVVASSQDGVAWALATTNPPAVISKLVFGDGFFVGASYSGEILCSSNGITWQIKFTEPSGEAFSGLAFSGGTFLAISGRSGTTFESSDGLNWQATGSTLPETALALDGYEGGYQSPLGLFGYYQTALPGCYSTVAAYKGTFLIGGAEGMMLQSGQLPPAVLSCQSASNQFSFGYCAQPDLPYRIQESTNLIQWTTAYSATGSGQPGTYGEALAGGGGKYFRIVSP
jgi:hypothetical protein